MDGERPSRSSNEARAQELARLAALTVAERMALALKIGVEMEAFRAAFERRGRLRPGAREAR